MYPVIILIVACHLWRKLASMHLTGAFACKLAGLFFAIDKSLRKAIFEQLAYFATQLFRGAAALRA